MTLSHVLYVLACFSLLYERHVVSEPMELMYPPLSLIMNKNGFIFP